MLTYEWDPTCLAPVSRLNPSSSKVERSYDLMPHPADPHSNEPLADDHGNFMKTDSYRREVVPGNELWVYEDTRGRPVESCSQRNC